MTSYNNLTPIGSTTGPSFLLHRWFSHRATKGIEEVKKVSSFPLEVLDFDSATICVLLHGHQHWHLEEVFPSPLC